MEVALKYFITYKGNITPLVKDIIRAFSQTDPTPFY